MIIFLGSVYPDSLFSELRNRGLFIDYPANIFQQSLLNGFDAHDKELKVITSPVIKASYSSVKDICRGYLFSHKNKSDRKDIYVGTTPIPGVQLLSELVRVYRATRRIVYESHGKNALIIYALHSPLLLSSVLLRNKVSCTCVIVPDLPEYMSSHSSLIKRLAKRLDRSIINFCLKRLDCYVLLSPYMREKLPIQGKKWALIEGIYDSSHEREAHIKHEEKIILYTGNLSRRYGIIDLLDAFEQIKKDNYRLWICGDGDGKTDVIQRSESDKRIVYYGVLSHDKVLSLQRQATVLVNPRKSTGEYTKYSFPSKTMEYLASGTPTIMCHLPAIPKEYDDYLFYIENENVEGIKERIEEVCEMSDDELDAFGIKAANFISSKKNSIYQTKKIMDLISQVRVV